MSWNANRYAPEDVRKRIDGTYRPNMWLDDEPDASFDDKEKGGFSRPFEPSPDAEE